MGCSLLLRAQWGTGLTVREELQEAARDRLLEELDALLDGEHRLLVARVGDDADHDPVEDARRARDHVDVAERDRVVRAWTDRRDQCWKRERRARPYFREVRSSSGSSG